MVAMFGRGFDSRRLHKFANAGRLTGIFVSCNVVGQATNNGVRIFSQGKMQIPLI